MLSATDAAFWQSIRDADYALPPGYDLPQLTAELLEFLGSPDPVLRDDYAYSILGYWIERDLYAPPQLREMIMLLVNNLSVGLGEGMDDRVFRRSFSALVLSEIARRDNVNPFLTEAEFMNLLRWAVEYLLLEQDTRGYIPKKGWAHATAHTADLLRRLARSRYAKCDDLERMLMAIAEKVTQPTPAIYTHNEDERLVLAVWAALQRQMLTMPFLVRWLARCVQVTALAPPDTPFNPAVFGAQQNTRNFLRSLYFRIAFSKQHSKLTEDLRPKVLAAVKAVGG